MSLKILETELSQKQNTLFMLVWHTVMNRNTEKDLSLDLNPIVGEPTIIKEEYLGLLWLKKFYKPLINTLLINTIIWQIFVVYFS